MEKTVQNQDELMLFGMKIGELLKGGDLIELVGDVGAGKTTLVKAIARGMGISDTVNSPSYTLSQVYEASSGLRLVHYDFYRLSDPGILAYELQEAMKEDGTVIAIEWSDIVADIVPVGRLRIVIRPLSETARQLTLTASGSRCALVLEQLA